MGLGAVQRVTARLEKEKKGSTKPGDLSRRMGSDWLSLFGWSTGLTGLARDFIFTYWGREWYHSRNGPLIGAVKGLLSTVTRRSGVVVNTVHSSSKLENAFLLVTKRAREIFDQDGPLKNLAGALADLGADPRFFWAIDQLSLEQVRNLRDTLTFLSTDLKTERKAPTGDVGNDEL